MDIATKLASEFTDEQIEFLCEILNVHTGREGGPETTPDNIAFVRPAYAKEAIDTLKPMVHEAWHETATRLWHFFDERSK